MSMNTDLQAFSPPTRLEHARALVRVKELEEQIKTTRSATICALAQLLDLKDLNTGCHSTRLAEWAVRVGREVGVDDNLIYDVEVAAILQGIGKIGAKPLRINRLTRVPWAPHHAGSSPKNITFFPRMGV